MQRAHAVVARSTFGSKKWQNVILGALLEVEMSKKHAIVVRSTFGSRTCQKKSASDHFWKLRCGKVHSVVVRSAFASQKFKSVKNTRGLGHFLTIRLPFDVIKVHAVVVRSTFASQKCKNLRVLSDF